MAAFAQFGSDLDASTQALLNRGARLTELLKQPQYSPLTNAEQVIVIYAGTKGYLDKTAVNEVTSFEKNLVNYLRSEGKAVVDELTSNDQKIEGEIENKIKSLLDKFLNTQI
jgi:F-type H+-transporting ATPase subunit alpha